MKKVVVPVIVALCVGGAFLWLNRQSRQSSETSSSSTTPSPTIATSFDSAVPAKNSKIIQYKNQQYRLFYYPIDTAYLIPNYVNKERASTLVSKTNCDAAINGGFYEEDGSPLGLVIVDNIEINPEIRNSNLITGFVTINATGQVSIGRDYNPDSNTVLQTGPYISSNQLLSLVSDKQARRSAIVEAVDGTHYAASVTFDKQTTTGPFLRDLPAILFSDQAPFDTVRAINLDGGAASYFFVKDDIELSELTPIGSMVCIN